MDTLNMSRKHPSSLFPWGRSPHTEFAMKTTRTFCLVLLAVAVQLACMIAAHSKPKRPQQELASRAMTEDPKEAVEVEQFVVRTYNIEVQNHFPTAGALQSCWVAITLWGVPDQGRTANTARLTFHDYPRGELRPPRFYKREVQGKVEYTIEIQYPLEVMPTVVELLRTQKKITRSDALRCHFKRFSDNATYAHLQVEGKLPKIDPF